jgi:hypothetical protein
VLIFTILTLSGQKSKDLLYLKNGNMIFGKLVEFTDSIYKIQTSDGSIFVYPISEVEKFVIETPAFEGRKKSGVGLALEAGVLAGAQNTKYEAPFSFNILLNFTNTTRNIFSIGSGVEYLAQPFMPLFGEYKVLFSAKKTTPFIFVRGGKMFHINGDTETTDPTGIQYNIPMSYKGGGSFTLGTGISWVKDGGETYLSFAYRNVHTSYQELDYNRRTNTYRNSFNRLEIKYGFKF